MFSQDPDIKQGDQQAAPERRKLGFSPDLRSLTPVHGRLAWLALLVWIVPPVTYQVTSWAVFGVDSLESGLWFFAALQVLPFLVIWRLTRCSSAHLPLPEHAAVTIGAVGGCLAITLLFIIAAVRSKDAQTGIGIVYGIFYGPGTAGWVAAIAWGAVAFIKRYRSPAHERQQE